MSITHRQQEGFTLPELEYLAQERAHHHRPTLPDGARRAGQQGFFCRYLTRFQVSAVGFHWSVQTATEDVGSALAGCAAQAVKPLPHSCSQLAVGRPPARSLCAKRSSRTRASPSCPCTTWKSRTSSSHVQRMTSSKPQSIRRLLQDLREVRQGKVRQGPGAAEPAAAPDG
ncbi:hypothetical protein DL89DRAFT_256526 [Linderina pennispora]|uniref:Uncharacterized protein n=1 Tax=Linderina pennispora TaxID=61395 RepID=A0A1Y1WED3_9FUNG|nr:uncharacterized protein DL89DRAFT_256526 [Linderina pennispora]ORX71524.1 hypothetical protein DL89DRAFT_256526 [Linderina pennispora]